MASLISPAFFCISAGSRPSTSANSATGSSSKFFSAPAFLSTPVLYACFIAPNVAKKEETPWVLPSYSTPMLVVNCVLLSCTVI